MAKARRRLNTTFLWIVGMSLASVLIVVLAVVFIHIKNGNPAKWTALAKQEMAAGQYDIAYQSLLRALAKRQTDPSLLTMAGDICYHQTTTDTENLHRARQYYNQALEMDPEYIPALRALLAELQDDLDHASNKTERAHVEKDMADIAPRLAKADPKDQVAAKAVALNPLHQYLDGTQIDPKKLDAAMAICKAAAAKYPADADYPFYMARVRYTQASDAAAQQKEDVVKARLADADKIMDDALHGQEKNPSMIFRSYEIHRDTIDHRVPYGLLSPAAGLKALNVQTDCLGQAASLVTPDNPDYGDIKYIYASELARDPRVPQQDRIKRIEAIYSDVLAHQPDNIAIRLAWGDELDRVGKRAEAIKLLHDKVATTQPVVGVTGMLLHFQDLERLSVLSRAELDELPLADPKQRQAMLDELDTNVATLLDGPGGADNAEIAYLSGRLQLAHGLQVQGVQTLSHALAVTDSANVQQRIATMFMLGRAYLATGQTGEAQRLAQDILNLRPDYNAGRLLLAECLVHNRDFDGAGKQLDILEKLAPDDPTVITLRLATLDATKDQSRIHAELDKLKPTDHDMAVAKANLAFRSHAFDVVEQLLEPYAKADSTDLKCIQLLASSYFDDNKKTQAIALLNAALLKNPKNPQLEMILAQVQGESGQALLKSEKQYAEEMKDPYTREMSLAAIAREDGNVKEWIQHMEAADQSQLSNKIDNPRLVLSLFQAYLSMRDWDNAEKYRQRLVKIDPDGAALSTEARWYLAHGDRASIAKALDIATDLTRKRGEFSGSWVVLGLVNMAQQRYDDAINNFTEALQKQVDNAEAYRGLVDCYYGLGDKESAKKEIQKAQAALPTDASFKEMALAWEVRYGDPQKALQPRLDALAASPSDRRAWINLASTYLALAKRSYQANDKAAAQAYYLNAADHLTGALKQWPDDGVLLAMCVGSRAEGGDFPGAEKQLLAWANRDSQKGNAHAVGLTAEFYATTHHDAQAETVLRTFLSTKHPDQADGVIALQVRLADLLSDQNRQTDALAVLPADSKDWHIVSRRIKLLLALRKPADADSALAAYNGGHIADDEQAEYEVQVLLMQNQLADARTLLNNVLEKHPSEIFCLRTRAALTINTGGDPQQAEDDLAMASSLEPQDVNTRMMLAELQTNHHQFADAAKEFEGIVRLNPDDRNARLRLIDVYVRSDPPRYIEAQDTINDARKRKALQNDTDIDAAEAMLNVRRQRYPDALVAARRCVSAGYGNLDHDHVFLSVLMLSGKFDEVLTQTTPMLAKDHDQWWIFTYRAQARLGAKDRAGALAEYRKALDVAGTNAAAAFTVVDDLEAHLETPDAIQLVEERAPKNEQFRILAAQERQRIHDLPGAIRWIQTSLADYDKLDPIEQKQALVEAGELYLSERPQETRKAIDVYQKLLKADPDNLFALNNLACLLADPGPNSDPKHAAEYSGRAYKITQSQGAYEPTILDTQGWVLIQNGQISDGEAMVKDAINRSKIGIPDAHYHLAEALLKQNSPSAAIVELNKAQQILDEAERDNQPLNDLLQDRIKDALRRAKAKTG